MHEPANREMAESKQRRVPALMSAYVLLACIAFTAVMVGAVLWLGARDPSVKEAAARVVPVILMTSFAMTVVCVSCGWRLAHGLARHLASAARPVEPDLKASLAGSTTAWRTLVKDPLTGLFSRDALLTFADDAIPYFRRYKRGVSILVVEIDRFKLVMATFGPAGADQALRHVADVIDLSVRKTDKAARFDADRFVVLLREIGQADTLALANRIRDAVVDLNVRHGDRTIPVTVSIGTAIVSEGDSLSETLIERAERALGAAKTDGGNRVAFQAASDVIALEDAA